MAGDRGHARRAASVGGASSNSPFAPQALHPSKTPQNILFIVMDDVGIDQMASFGWGGPVPPKLPNLDAIASASVKFTNVWAMPECSPSRAAFFTGRYPFRTGVTSAIIDNMLPAAQTSPYETTLPRVLATAGYKSAMIGKFHLGDQNPAGDCSPATLGFDFFDGNLGASPGPIDTQAGNSDAEPGTYPCGFDQSGTPGACYQSDGTCSAAADGKACLESDGLFLSGAGCQASTPSILDFSRTNSYYVWNRSTVAGPIPPPTGLHQCGNEPNVYRQYMTAAQTGSGIDWWKSQRGPRMLSVTYNAIHTPYQQAPSTPTLSSPAFVCVGNTASDIASQRLIATSVFEAMDKDIGVLLQGLGLARLNASGTIITVNKPDGPHIPELDRSNTLVAIIGDNGTYGVIVKPPFDPVNSKGTVYQTGVSVPAIVAGTLVKGLHGRSVGALVNAVDFFQLFSEAAGVKENEVVPPAHILDSRPMLGYLTHPYTTRRRDLNFTQLGPGVFQIPTNTATRSWPCVIGASVQSSDGSNTMTGGTCSEILFNEQSLCEQENNGIWLGPHNDGQPPLQFPNPDSADSAWNSCCDVQSGLDRTLKLLPINQWAIRDTRFKFLKQQFADCSKPLCPGPQCTTVFPPFATKTTYEFYNIGQTRTNPAGLDCPYGTSEPDNLGYCKQPNDLACAPDSGIAPEACVPNKLKPRYEKLQKDLNNLLASEPACPGDGNLDKFVNQFDVQGVNDFFGDNPSFFDFNDDGKTNSADLAVVEQNLGADCLDLCVRADLNRDGKVNGQDLKLVKRAVGTTCTLCGADLNGDGVVNQADVSIERQAIAACHGKR
ncbi:MAG TPA: sulfatase-like hydrolase/transferase [Candidatus Binataceae bacterium]